MIVRKDKTYETRSDKPNENWYEEEDNYIVDETTEEGRILAQKIIENYPYFDFVFDDKGNIIDIIPTGRPDPGPVIPEPSLEEKNNLQIAQNTAETLEVIATLNEMQRIEQAQSNAELIELILSLTGGM